MYVNATITSLQLVLDKQLGVQTSNDLIGGVSRNAAVAFSLAKDKLDGMLNWVGNLNPLAEQPQDFVPGASTSNVRIRMDQEPFANGGLREAFKGQISLHRDWSPCVFKRYLSPDVKNVYLDTMEVSTIAHFLAEEYNKQRKPGMLEVEFLRSHVVYTEDLAYFFCEDVLDVERWKRFNTNNSFWSPDVLRDDPDIATLLHFLRFTYEYTNHRLVVTDLQGVKKLPRGYRLTDPAILTGGADKERFGRTNLGPKLMTDNYKEAGYQLQVLADRKDRLLVA